MSCLIEVNDGSKTILSVQLHIYCARTFFFNLLLKHISLHVNNNIIYQAYIAHVFVPKVLHIFYVHEDTILCTKLSNHS